MSTSNPSEQFQVPTYAEVIDCLALGFGVATTEEERITSAKSWATMQDRYRTTGHFQRTKGLINKLTDLLSGGCKLTKEMLEQQLIQYEFLLSSLREIPLFTKKTRLEGLLSFLGIFVFPQVAVFLWRGSHNFDATTPLHHLRVLFPPLGDKTHNASATIKKVVNAQLFLLPDQITKEAIDDIERLLSHLDSRSNPSLKRVDDCCKRLSYALKTDLKGDETAAVHVAAIKAALVAGLAVKRFIERLMHPNGKRDGSQLLGSISYCYARLEVPREQEEFTGFFEAHLGLFDALMVGFPLDPARVPTFRQHFDVVSRLFLQDHGCQVIAQCEPAAKLEELLNRPTLHRNEYDEALKALRAHGDYSLYEPLHLYFSAFIPLADGNLQAALKTFKEFLQATTRKQLGSYAFRAATLAISLEVITRPYIRRGALEALVLQRISSQPQSVVLTVGIPTVFGAFCRLPSLPVSVQSTFDAIADFNTNNYPVSEGKFRAYCNPLERLDSMMAKLHTLTAKPSPLALKRRDVIHQAVAETYKDHSVLSFCKLKPYEALRDVLYYLDRMRLSFCKLKPYEALRDVLYYLDRMSTKTNPTLGFDLNQNLCHYLTLPEIDQHSILEGFDPECYEKDKFNPPLFTPT